MPRFTNAHRAESSAKEGTSLEKNSETSTLVPSAYIPTQCIGSPASHCTFCSGQHVAVIMLSRNKELVSLAVFKLTNQTVTNPVSRDGLISDLVCITITCVLIWLHHIINRHPYLNCKNANSESWYWCQLFTYSGNHGDNMLIHPYKQTVKALWKENKRQSTLCLFTLFVYWNILYICFKIFLRVYTALKM